LWLGRELVVPLPQALVTDAHRVGRHLEGIAFADDQIACVSFEIVRVTPSLRLRLVSNLQESAGTGLSHYSLDTSMLSEVFAKSNESTNPNS
jgi:hypothetical protein